MLKEFKAFIMRGNVVDLAVAVVIGAAFGAVVNSLVKNLITPLIAAIVGEQNFSELKFTLNDSEFMYGEVVNAVLSFLFVAAAIFFFVVKPLNWLSERRKRGEVEPESLPAPSDEALLLGEIRDLLRDQGSRSDVRS